MSNISCGIDFGTSNSSIAVANRGNIHLVAVEGTSITIPSAMFFLRKGNVAFYGREAVNKFLTRNPGRLMRSLKRVLGTPIMRQGTMVNGELMKFDQIIAAFLQNIKEKADADAGQQIENVVMGRPVHFVDNDPAANDRAQAELRSIATQLGFKNIDFQFEPIAAAFAHEVNISGEKLALVADLGGGTSDFTVIRLSNRYINKHDRSGDILANTGIRVGGNDFDKDLSLAAIMPELGYKSTYGTKNLEVPLRHYYDLSEWSKVNFLYTTKIISQTRQLLYESHDKPRFKRLLQVLEQETGHALLAVTEETKIALTADTSYNTPFDFIEEGLTARVTRKQFDTAISMQLQKISAAALQCLTDAGVDRNDIDLVILTGGTTEVPSVQAEFAALFPNAALADENKLSSVGLGLAYDSQNKFG
ncbi:Hsp70 family protein [Dyadobacter psychrotolerans]|uniref:Hsp70 family protein n=1 Tax=Dyadobacter psychrotolerans TaxID=2541721 RepID=A0A4R5DW10_9BACT|nr:Hsp70 family protein [Dyadobacter psychrotolerans]TDE15435.1 Hsp70 family protein [Dyadobacter psychrotolerans]